jgi:hypothetical protein
MSAPLPPDDHSDLTPLFDTLRREPLPTYAAAVAQHLPTRVAARLRHEALANATPSYSRSLVWFAPIAAAFAIWAGVDLLQLSRQAFSSPEIAVWMAAFFA